MSNNLYTAFLGMRARQRHLDTLANNIANASTTGFKSDGVRYEEVTAPPTENPAATQSASRPEASSDERKRTVAGVIVNGATNFASGAIRPTGRSLDVALQGDGFLAVQTPQGERYTRAGSLTINADGQLTTQNGFLVIGERGPITVPPGEVAFTEDGDLSVGGETIDRLRVVRFNDQRAALMKAGDSLFAATGAEQPTPAQGGVRVVGGALEMSNVDPITEMAAMMQTNREFESLQKSVSLMMNDLGRKISNEIGRI